MVKNGHKSSFAYWGLIQAFLAANLAELEKRHVKQVPLLNHSTPVEAQFSASD
jgi:hypothetical protein